MNAELNENFEYRVPTFDNIKVELNETYKKVVLRLIKRKENKLSLFYCSILKSHITLKFSKELLFNVAGVK